MACVRELWLCIRPFALEWIRSVLTFVLVFHRRNPRTPRQGSFPAFHFSFCDLYFRPLSLNSSFSFSWVTSNQRGCPRPPAARVVGPMATTRSGAAPAAAEIVAEVIGGDLSALPQLNHRHLQRIAKKFGIKGNKSTDGLIDSITKQFDTPLPAATVRPQARAWLWCAARASAFFHVSTTMKMFHL